MIFGKETETLEFKKTTGELKEAVISIVSILNKSGKGEVYFGIKNDGSVLGQQIGDATLRDISKAISDSLKPQIFPTIDMVAIDDKECIRVTFSGTQQPYYAFGRAYIRVADEDKQMSPDELEGFIIRKHEQTSNWDSSPSQIGISDVDAAVLEKYIDKANTAGRLDYQYTDAKDILSRLRLIENEVLNNTADVMFGKQPRLEIQMAIFATTEKLTFNDIYRAEGRVLDLVDIAERYIRNAMRYRVIIDGSQISRKEIPEIPHVAIREALLNSFCHKNYRTPQNNEVAIFSNRIEIYNPGTFPVGVTPEDYIKGEGRTIHRNPLLAQIMYFSKDIERFGTGLKRIADTCDEAGIKFKFVSDYYGFTVVFYRPPLWTSDRIDDNIGDSICNNIGDSIGDSIGNNIGDSIGDREIVNGTQVKIIELMRENPHISANLLAQKIGIAKRNIEVQIKSLKEHGHIEREGAAFGGRWIVKTGRILPVCTPDASSTHLSKNSL
ncbi:MAG: putative DNA binding domain-containing protein [Oscillospiraceae bacterium]|nr:putative DNA binding domain-containing protein [Oscillospiraceae bacterium]